MKYKFENDLEKNQLSMDVIDARRFGKAIKEAIHGLELEARCYALQEEPYVLETMAFLKQMASRLTAKEYVPEVPDSMNNRKQTASIRYDESEDCVYYDFPDGGSMSLNASDAFYVWIDGHWTWTTLFYDSENGWRLGAAPELDLRSAGTLQASVDDVFEGNECHTSFKDKAYYIEKAKRQRGLTDEQIDFFLQNHPRWDLLPYYACYVKKMGMQGALEEVRAQFD